MSGATAETLDVAQIEDLRILTLAVKAPRRAHAKARCPAVPGRHSTNSSRMLA